ncbi:DUF5753 domain-containing protein [Streptomyces bobili]|uniref:DUF5753 domain-containing protein n=1 Tax=Streptomyces bobili TaxID=67280 RepID=UPI00370275A8
MAGRHGRTAYRLPADEVDARVEFRVRRRTVFEREKPTPLVALVHEAALRMRYGGRKVAKGQLEFLLETSAWPAVTVRVIPFACEEFIEAAHSLLYASGVVPQLDTVHLDGPLGGIPVTDAAGLVRFAGMLDFAERAALSERASRQLIHHIAQEL